MTMLSKASFATPNLDAASPAVEPPSTDAAVPRKLATSAGERVVIEAFRIARVLGSADRSIGGPPRAWLLHRLAQSPGIRVADLADSCGLDASTTSRHVRNLEDAGLVVRSGDPDDRRAARLSLTGAGQQALASALRVRADLVSRATADWPAADQRQLRTLLTRLADDLAERGTSRTAAPSGVPTR